jgi:hypothetical protein
VNKNLENYNGNKDKGSIKKDINEASSVGFHNNTDNSNNVNYNNNAYTNNYNNNNNNDIDNCRNEYNYQNINTSNLDTVDSETSSTSPFISFETKNRNDSHSFSNNNNNDDEKIYNVKQSGSPTSFSSFNSSRSSEVLSSSSSSSSSFTSTSPDVSSVSIHSSSPTFAYNQRNNNNRNNSRFTYSSLYSDSSQHSDFLAGVTLNPPLLHTLPERVLPPLHPPILSHSDRALRLRNRISLINKIEEALLNTPNIPIGGRLGIKHFLNRWTKIKGNQLVFKGIMPIYTNKAKAFDFWNNNKRDWVFKGTDDRRRLHDEKIQELITSNTIKETTFEELTWINPTHLVQKSNGKFRLVIDTRNVNYFMRKIHFKMEGIPTLIDLWEKDDFAIS